MASNHYLRYKYYLCTRMVSEELYTAVKDIFASLNFEQNAKVSPSHHAEAVFGVVSDVKFGTSLAELLKLCLQIDGSVNVGGNFKTSFSGLTETTMDNFLSMEQLPKLDNSNAVKSEHNLDFVFKQTAVLMREIFCFSTNAEHDLNVITSFRVGGSEKTSTEIYGTENFKSTLSVSVPVANASKVFTMGEIKAEASVAVPIDTFANVPISALYEPFFRLLQALNIDTLKMEGECSNKMSISMHRITKLSDYDDISIANMDERSLSDLDLIEQN